MRMHEKQNVERTARRSTKLRMPGGVPQRRIREDILIVRDLRFDLSVFSCSVVAISALSQTITFLTQAGRFRQAADREKEIGQIYQQEFQDLRKACESFERAGEWYLQEDATAYDASRSLITWLMRDYSSTANACFKDAADLHAQLENYSAAIARYDQVANASLGSALTKYSVKDYWFKAGLCALAMKVRVPQLLALLI